MHHENIERIWHLLARKTAGEITGEEAKELDIILQQHPHASFIQDLLIHDWSDKNKSFSSEETATLLAKHKRRLAAAMDQSIDDEKPLSPKNVPFPARVKSIKTIRYWMAAAGVLTMLILGLRWWLKPAEEQHSIAMERLETKSGSRSEILLPDGTKVWLNAGSSLDYPRQFTGNTRNVQLIGEAYFDVVKDAHKPFLVHTRAFTVKVIGTIFNIRAYADEDSAVTSLIQGAVEVQLGKSGNNVVKMKPNEKLTVAMPERPDTDDNSTPAENQDNIEKIYVKRGTLTTMKDSTIVETAWTENKLAFKNTSFEKIAVLLGKWFGTDIRFKNEDKKQINLTGTFQRESLDEVLHALQLTGTQFKYEKDNAGVIWIE
ncbi:MAG TPA: FecR family protein [Agriterribacter sp.]|nr:FecR family protein [Chitinophagaceae bacterium]HRP30640.1 FecR family protein [Agriterribacter sp.]